MKNQSYRKGWAFVLTLVLVFTTMFGGFGFLGINGIVDEVYAATPRNTTLDLTTGVGITIDELADEGWAWDGTTTPMMLTLSGINLSTASSAGIIVPTDTAIVLVGNNYVESTQASGSFSYGLYAVNGLTISGSGTLTVTGGSINSSFSTYGMYVDKGNTTINNGTVTASGGTTLGWNGRSYGIYHTGWTLTINGGTVTATGGTASGDTGISNGLCGGGNLVMNGGILNATGGTATNNGSNFGISYVGSIQFNGGTTTVTTNNATQRGAVYGSSGITLDTDEWISAPAGVGLNSGGNNIVTLSDGTTRATSAIISPYIAPTISVNDSSVTEGNSGSINLGFIVSLSAASVQTVTVNYATANGTATAGSDYTSTSGALTFSPGETSKTVNVSISGDTTLEPNETIFLNLTSPTKATISDAQGIGTITNDDVSNIITAASITMTAPAAGGTPQTAGNVETATGNSNYTVSGVTWNQAMTAGGKFKAGTAYTATVVLTSKNVKEFQSAAFTPSVAGAASVGNTSTTGIGTGNTVSFTVTYAPTAALAVSSISVTTQPTKLTYMETADGVLALNGMIVTATNNDGSTTAAVFTDGTAVGYTASPANGSTLTVAGHNGQPATIIHQATGRNAPTANLVVAANSAKAITSFNFNGLTPNVTGTVNEGAKTIALTVPYGTNVTALVPTITHSGVSITSNSGIAKDFTSPVTYTVTAADSSTEVYTVTVTVASNGGSGGGGGSSTPATPIINTNTGSVTGNQLKNAADAAKDGGTVTIKSDKTSEVSFPNSGLDSLSGKNNSLTVVTDKGTLTFDSKAVGAIGTQATATDIKVIVDDVVKTTLTEEQQTKVGDKTVYDLSVMSGGKLISSFNGGKVNVSIPYELKIGETAENLTVWYMADDGSLTEINCTYDAKNKAVTFVVDHFSKYIIGQDELAGWVNPFTDLKSSAWYYDAAAFVNKNGLMNGQTGTTFGPQTAMTRGMFVTILGRMEGIDATVYASKNTFSDVKSNQYYAPYIAWATDKGIVSGMGGDKFAPNTAVTREQMSVMMTNYLKFKGQGPAGAWAIQLTYSDLDKVSSWADEAVMFMTMKDLMNGMGNDAKGNPMFAPKSTSTRAQTAQVMMSLGEVLK